MGYTPPPIGTTALRRDSRQNVIGLVTTGLVTTGLVLVVFIAVAFPVAYFTHRPPSPKEPLMDPDENEALLDALRRVRALVRAEAEDLQNAHRQTAAGILMALVPPVNREIHAREGLIAPPAPPPEIREATEKKGGVNVRPTTTPPPPPAPQGVSPGRVNPFGPGPIYGRRLR